MELHRRIATHLERHLDPAFDLLKLMVDINSFTANRNGVDELGRITAAAFQPLDFEAEFVASDVEGFGHHVFLCRKGRTARTITFVSHLDTVYPPDEEARNDFRWRKEGDRIYGPGIVDIKGGTVMIHMVLSAIRAVAPNLFEDVSWRVLLNAAEEDRAPNFSQCARRILKEDRTLACLVFEGGRRNGSTYTLVTARKGRAAFRVTAEGRGAHAGSHHPRGVNAVVQIAWSIGEIAALTDYEQDLTFNVGNVSGGTVVNRVPHWAEANVEMRAFTTEAYEAGKRGILALRGKSTVSSAIDGRPCTVTVEVREETGPWPKTEETEGLFRLWKSAAETMGLNVEAEQRGGLSDGNYFWDVVPTIDGLGPVGDNAHCSERTADGSKVPEYLEISSLIPKATLNTIAILKLAAGSE